MYNIICKAIESKLLIELMYDGGIRYVEPYIFGSFKNGTEALSVYQIGGYSSSGKIEGWKTLYLSKASNINITEETFKADRSGYNPNDKRFVKILSQVY